MDPSKQGLLGPRGGFRDSFDDDDVRDSLDIDYVPDKHRTSLSAAEKSAATAGFRVRRRKASSFCGSCCSFCIGCFTGRSRKCILSFIAVLIVVFFSLSTGSYVAWDKYTRAPPDGLSPPWYPTPKGGTAKTWTDSYKKAHALVARMTLPEKVNITTGTGWQMGPAVGNTGPATNVGFPSLALQDGPLGIRFADNATAFPAGVTVGATWSKDLMYQWGNAHAIEARNKGVNVILGPCIGPLGRMPAAGRNWEGFGADPYLSGIAAAQSIKGMQDEGVMATIKHLVANEQEHFRQSWEWGLPNAISSNIDDRTMHELYMWPFGDAVKAGVASVMCSYNQVNNSYACGNSKLLNGLLRDEMGFQGFVQSDWLAARGGVSTALAGLDMLMPGDGLFWAQGNSLWGAELTRSVLNGSLPLDRLNDMVTRIVAAWYQFGQDDETKFDPKGPNFSSWTDEEYGILAPGSPTEQEKTKVNSYVDVMEKEHVAVARAVAAEGTVLLKNNGILPITRDGKTGTKASDRRRDGKPLRIAIFGEDAGPGEGPNVCKDRDCNQGTLGSGWGSGAVEFPYLITPVEALTKGWTSKESGGKVNVTSYLTNSPNFKDPEILADADVCIVFANADSGEGLRVWDSVKGDRPNLLLQKGGDDLAIAVALGCGGDEPGDVVVVIHTVGPVTMENWIDLPRVKGVIVANLPGQESGNALADVIFGDVNPSGHLPWTIGKSLDDYGPGAKIMYTPNGVVPQQDFSEGLYVDYRHFDKFEVEPRFEFGFGLSYTQFELSGLRVKDGAKGARKGVSALPAARPKDFAKPPAYDTAIPDPKEALFPKGFRKLKKFVYPYLDSVDEFVTADGELVKQGGAYPYPAGYDVAQEPSGAGGDEGGNPDLWETYVTVEVEVKNTGGVKGKAVPQVYLGYPGSKTAAAAAAAAAKGAEKNELDFPVRVLRGFEKIELGPGESRTVQFNLTRRDLSYWDVVQQNWVLVVDAGEYEIGVGFSSRDLRVKGHW
ncbi:glycoside hydrolase family 3 protein [Microdochium bolleyi]|uniref:Beta-glucosidase cel3A n=1 Tax=Microdochium bolleyi TaxID=196109 RepID=A0A136J9L0_9PEZI|nr:glycoside hydrolase family 3 protein [Microdochium bolleyi]